MLAKNKPHFNKIVGRIIPYFSFVHPNWISLFSLLVSIIFFICIVSGHVLIAFFVLFGTITDAIDGAVARYFHKTSLFGSVLDSTGDRLSDIFLLSAFSFAHLIRWEITIPLITISFLISYVRARGEMVFSVSMEGIGIMERTERIIGIFITLIAIMTFKTTIFGFSFGEIIFLILIACSIQTFYQRLFFLWKKKSH